MTTKQILALVIPHAVKTERGINTNNGWGFGGAVKDVYHLPNGHSVHKGVASFRHLPNQPFINLRDSRGRILTEEPKEIAGYIAQIK